MGAQRLSASSEFTLLIKICFPDLISVLNAFRHHRNSHDRSSRRSPRLRRCAQRLSASSEFTLSRSSKSSPSNSCAQRLSASSEFTLFMFPLFFVSPICAQRLSASSEFTLLKMKNPSIGVYVLNAFRHHRNSHSRVTCTCAAALRCSTPFGIIGIHTFP